MKKYSVEIDFKWKATFEISAKNKQELAQSIYDWLICGVYSINNVKDWEWDFDFNEIAKAEYDEVIKKWVQFSDDRDVLWNIVRKKYIWQPTAVNKTLEI